MAQFIDQPAEADGPIIEFIKVSQFPYMTFIRAKLWKDGFIR
jgi:hypothetical protein